MGKLFKIGQTIKLLDDAISGLGVNVFPTSRPSSVPDKMTEFAVVSLPVSVVNMTIGSSDPYGLTRTTCRVEVFVRDKGGLEDVYRLDELVNGVVDLFPVAANGICVSNPSVVMSGRDGYGFHVVSIQADVHTM